MLITRGCPPAGAPALGVGLGALLCRGRPHCGGTVDGACDVGANGADGGAAIDIDEGCNPHCGGTEEGACVVGGTVSACWKG